jgi:predicted RNA-binding Zn-ribbon protein involved in translation (DUF1610 family)
MSEAECPYCGDGIQINHGDGYGYDEGGLHKQECYLCNKTFSYRTIISVSYDTRQADCLNGGEHRFRTKDITPDSCTYRCVDCGFKKSVKLGVKEGE